jgi:hypothetical protein
MMNEDMVIIDSMTNDTTKLMEVIEKKSAYNESL